MNNYKYRAYDSWFNIIEFKPEELRLDVTLGNPNKLEKLSDIYGEPKIDEIPYFRMNLGFFNMDGSCEHLGTFVDEKLYYSAPNSMFIDLIYDFNNKLIVKKIPDLNEVSYWQGNSHWAVGTGFSLLQNGEINLECADLYNHSTEKQPRSAIGQRADGTIIAVTVDGRSSESAGVTAQELAEFFKSAWCVNAVSCDGGGSSELIIGDSIYNVPSDGDERSIGSAFVAYNTVTINDLDYFPTIKSGSKGIYAQYLQRFLASQGYTIAIDGDFGPVSTEILKLFQSNNGLVNDGVAGRNTWNFVLCKILGIDSQPEPSTNDIIGDMTNSTGNINICIDPGHGGEDPGAVANGLVEKTLNLELSGLFGNGLKKQGFGVVYTRTTDVAVELTYRGQIAKDNNCNCLLSIHFNAYNTQAHGCESMYSFLPEAAASSKWLGQ